MFEGILWNAYDTAVGLGLVTGQTIVKILGHTTNVNIGVQTDVWEGQGLYPFQSAASILEAVSTSASDSAGGIGLRFAKVQGLDSAYNQIEEIIALNGITPVQTVNSYLRVNFFFIAPPAGSNATNVGDVALSVAGNGPKQAVMKAGMGYSQSCIYTVPAGFTLTNNQFFCNITLSTIKTNNSAQIGFLRRVDNTQFITSLWELNAASPYIHTIVSSSLIDEKTDFSLRVISTDTSGTELSAGLTGILIKK